MFSIETLFLRKSRNVHLTISGCILKGRCCFNSGKWDSRARKFRLFDKDGPIETEFEQAMECAATFVNDYCLQVAPSKSPQVRRFNLHLKTSIFYLPIHTVMVFISFQGIPSSCSFGGTPFGAITANLDYSCKCHEDAQNDQSTVTAVSTRQWYFDGPEIPHLNPSFIFLSCSV